MKADQKIFDFLSGYDEQVAKRGLLLREIVLKTLPGIEEQLDIPARMIAYCYGQKYSELICVIIPSKKGLKLGFNRGTQINDPDKLLQGTGKVSRFVEIKSEEQIESTGLIKLLENGYSLYKEISN